MHESSLDAIISKIKFPLRSNPHAEVIKGRWSAECVTAYGHCEASRSSQSLFRTKERCNMPCNWAQSRYETNHHTYRTGQNPNYIQEAAGSFLTWGNDIVTEIFHYLPRSIRGGGSL
jgi:hypothetical protein